MHDVADIQEGFAKAAGYGLDNFVMDLSDNGKYIQLNATSITCRHMNVPAHLHRVYDVRVSFRFVSFCFLFCLVRYTGSNLLYVGGGIVCIVLAMIRSLFLESHADIGFYATDIPRSQFADTMAHGAVAYGVNGSVYSPTTWARYPSRQAWEAE